MLLRLAAGVLLAGLAVAAQACDCADRYLNVTNGKKNATALFTATPTAKTGHFGDMLYTMRVESIWRGTLLKQSYIFGGTGSCAFVFRIGTMYLVYAHSGRGTLDEPAQTTVCASNKEIGGASSDLRVLGKPVAFYDRIEKRAPNMAGVAAHPAAVVRPAAPAHQPPAPQPRPATVPLPPTK